MADSLITLLLTNEQTDQLAPIVRSAAASRKNVLFLASVGPDNGVWRLQVMTFSMRVGNKIRKLIAAELVDGRDE